MIRCDLLPLYSGAQTFPGMPMSEPEEVLSNFVDMRCTCRRAPLPVHGAFIQTQTRMKRRTHLLFSALGALILGGTIYGCAALKSLPTALSNLKQLQFKLEGVNNMSVNGVNVSSVASRGQISLIDVGRLTAAFAQKSLPVQFTLNVAAKNPNTAAAGSNTDLFLRKIAWTLYIDDRPTINGVTEQRLAVPGGGQTVNIPITMSLDLYKFFNDRGFDDMLNLALAIGGAQGSSSRLKMTARVAAEVPPLGVFEYPGEITVVNTAFSNP